MIFWVFRLFFWKSQHLRVPLKIEPKIGEFWQEMDVRNFFCLDLKERISNRMQLREEQKAERQRKQLVNILTLFKCQTILGGTYKF